MRSKIFFAIIISLILLASLNVYPSWSRGDTQSYLDGLQALTSGQPPANFVPNRLLTTYLGLQTIRGLAAILALRWIQAWLLMNIFFYLLAVIFFYLLLKGFGGNDQVAIVGTILLIANYAMIAFGLANLMDIGGWAFYLVTIYLCWRFINNPNPWLLILASGLIGIGGLFKEYTFLGYLVLAGVIIYQWRLSWWRVIKWLVVSGFLASLPFALVSWYIYSHFHYDYLTWFKTNSAHYVYSSRLVEYIKSFGSLYNFGWLLFLPSLYTLFTHHQIIERKKLVFLLVVGLSVVPIFFWPAITQRILFITVPLLILVSTFFIHDGQPNRYALAGLLTLYFLAGCFMDSYLLPMINI